MKIYDYTKIVPRLPYKNLGFIWDGSEQQESDTRTEKVLLALDPSLEIE